MAEQKTGSASAEVSSEEQRPIIACPTQGPSWFSIVLVMIILSVIVSAGSIYVYDRYFSQKIVAMDLKGFLAGQQQLYIEGKLTENQFKSNMDKFDAALKSIPDKRVVLMGDCVLKGVDLVPY